MTLWRDIIRELYLKHTVIKFIFGSDFKRIYQFAEGTAQAVLSVLLNLIFLFGVPLKINYRWIKDAIVRYLPDTLLLLIRHIYNLAVKSF